MLPRHTTAPRRGSTTAALTRAAVSLLVLAALLVGMPYGLWRLGSLPTTVPSWSEAQEALFSPDDGSLLLTVLTLIGWGLWCALLYALLLEVGALLRHRTARRRRGISGLQGAAAWLLGGLVLLGTPAAASAATATPAVAAPLSPTASGPADDGQRPGGASADRQRGEPVHRVSADNPTLWGIAEERLGDGRRWKDIQALNPDLHGVHAELAEGQVLKMPSDTPPAAAAPKKQEDKAEADSRDDQAAEPRDESESYTVRPGDTLWGIADEELDDPTRWRQIAKANKDTVEDPDLIYPQQELQLPTTADAPPASPPRQKPAPDKEAPPAGEDTGADAPGGHAEEEHEHSGNDQVAPSQTPSPSRQSETAQQAPSPSSSPSSRPSDAGQDEADDEESGAPALAIAGGLLAAGVVGGLATRRVVQQRRRRRGRRIAMPQPDSRTARTEQQLHASTPDPEAGVEWLDAVLRTAAVHLTEEGRELPQLTLVTLGEDGVVLHLADPAPPVPPFTADSEAGELDVWWCPVATPELLEERTRRDVDAPYPALVSLGWDSDGSLLLVDLEHIGVLRLTGPDRLRLARTLAVELAASRLVDDITVTLVADPAPGLAELEPEHLTDRASFDEARGPLLAHHAEQQRALETLGVSSLRQARLGAAGAGGWTPHVVIGNTDAAEGDEEAAVAAVMEAAAARPATSTAIIATSGPVPSSDGQVGWTLHADAGEPVRLPDIEVDCHLQVLTDEQYDDVLDLLATTGRGDVPAPEWDQFEPTPPTVGSELSPLEAEDSPGDAAVRGEEAEHGEPETAEAPEAVGGGVEAAALDERGPRGVMARLADTDDEESAEGDVAAGEAAKPAAPWQEDAATSGAPLPLPRTRSDITELPATGSAGEPVAAAAADAERHPVVRVLGDVDVRGARGTIEPKRVRPLTELATWLVLHPGRDHRALDEAFWPGREVDRKVRNPYISRLRSWLGTADDGERYLPLITDTTDARYSLDPRVGCDWIQFQQLVRKAERTSDASGTRALRQALELVRGRPFAAVRADRYVWAEHLVQEMIAAIVDAAEMLGERYLVAGDARGALWAATRGLDAVPESEQLYRVLFQAHYALGDLEELKRAARRLDALNDELGVEAEDDTIALINSLLAAV